MQHKTILFFALLILTCANLSAQQQYYSVKFPDDRTITGCGATADTSDWPVIQQFSNCNFNVGVSVKDQVFNLNATGGCKKILRTWKLIWWCDFNPNWPAPTGIDNPANTDVGPTVIGNALNHGFLQYTQIIKISDNVPPVFLNCPDAPVTFCDLTNNDPAQYGNRCEGPIDLNVKVTDLCSKSDITLTYRLYLDLDGDGSMETFRTSSAPDAWPIEKTISNDTVAAKIKLPTGVGLPYGTHKVEWIANDGCGNQSICKYEFIVKDCKAPTVVCHNGLSVNIMPTGMITFWATDFLLYANDNCTPSDLLKIAIRKAGTGFGYPAFNTSVTFDCNEIGQQFVEIWAEDASGNADFCQTFVKVQDNIGVCTPPGPVSGNIATDNQQNIPGAKVTLKNNLSNTVQPVLTTTNAQGKYQFAGAPGTCNYSITPQLDTLPALGVNTLDVLLANWHISGQELLPTPYRIIAADVNKDGQLTSADLDAMGDLITGTATGFAGNTAWRFVPASHIFANPANPLASSFPEKISTVCPVASGENQHFIAIKTGDLDASADMPGNFTGDADDRSGEGKTVNFRMPNQRFEAGDDVVAMLYAPELSSLLGFQFTLETDPAVLSIQLVEPLLNERTAAFPEQGRVTASWYTKPGENTGELPVLRVTFKALQNGSLRSNIHLTSATTTAEAYDLDRSAMNVGLVFKQVLSELSTPVSSAKLSPIAPNPATGSVTADFYMPESGNVDLAITNINGVAVAQHHGTYEAGWHKVQIPVNIAVSGVYCLRLQSAFGNAAQRVMLQR